MMMKVSKMKYLGKAAVFVLSLLLIALWSSVAAAAIGADDFLPPAQATGAQRDDLLAVNDEASVVTEVDPVLNIQVTTAATLQDAINSIIDREDLGAGCEIISDPNGGYAFVATGTAAYQSDHQNVNASRIAQRNAYVVAFMNAKAEMAKTVGEIVVRGGTNFDQKIETLDSTQRALVNIESELSEQQLQSVRQVLKGYVTYDVDDKYDEGRNLVYVTLVSSPKTRGKFSRYGTDGVIADDLRDGLNSVLAEIRHGFVPPVGGRIIEVPETGEIAYVGFGSSVVRYDPEADVQEELKLQAERIAGLRATDALAGIILGDDTSWRAQVDETTVRSLESFERQQESDQTTKDSEADIQAHAERRRLFFNSLSETVNIQTLRQGVLPPGVMRRTILDDNEYFAYGIAVYVPSLSDAVREAAREMEETQLVRPPRTDAGNSAPPSAAPTPDAADTPERTEREAPEIQRGPSGVVEQDL